LGRHRAKKGQNLVTGGRRLPTGGEATTKVGQGNVEEEKRKKKIEKVA